MKIRLFPWLQTSEMRTGFWSLIPSLTTMEDSTDASPPVPRTSSTKPYSSLSEVRGLEYVWNDASLKPLSASPCTENNIIYEWCLENFARVFFRKSKFSFLPVSPRFTIKPNSSEVLEGFPVWMHCQAEGDPVPQVHWDRNSQINFLTHETPRIKIFENGNCIKLQCFSSALSTVRIHL